MFHRHVDFAVYKTSEAARLLGISNSKIRRWVGGYKSERNGEIFAHPPLWEPQYQSEDDLYIGFRDLIEIRFVDAFSRAGLSKNSIRELLSKARSFVGQDYPLSTQTFKTDGRTLFLEIWESEASGQPTQSMDVKNGQLAFRSIVSPSFKDLDFEGGQVSKWYIDGRNRNLSVEPNVAFGQPVVDETGIPTARILEAFQAEGSEKTVASQFEITLSDVRSAIDFEMRLGGHR